MPTIPVSQAPGAPSSETVEERFQRFRQTWLRETGILSSMSTAAAHPAYLEIIRMGREVVPLLLRDMEENNTHWFIAMETITGAKPYFPGTAGKISKLVEAWLVWAKENGYR